MSQFETLVRASRLYYELGETQGRIAELLGVTRPQVSRLLKQARAEGIVEIRIVDRTTDDSPAAMQLRDRFGLRAVHLAPSLTGPADLTRRSIGRLAAHVLRAAVRDGSVVGIGDGTGVAAAVDALADATGDGADGANGGGSAGRSGVNAIVVPLAGGFWFTGPGREPFRRAADALGATVHGLPAPGLLDEPETRRALCAHPALRAVFDLWARLDVALFGIGGPAWNDAAFGRDVVRELDQRRAVGEVLIAPFDLDGTFVGTALRERTIAFDPRDLPRVPTTIGTAGGASKVGPILGALRAAAVNTLVTDVRTAESVVTLDDETRERVDAVVPIP